ncbi:MAG: right-handed parallel beta-helix repeat-containing protein [Lentisphaeria bacterium]
MEKMSAMNVFDVSLEDFPRLAGEQSDNGRFNRAVAAAADRVLFVPAGVYELSETLKINNLCSLLMHKSAVIRAVAEMDYVLVYDAKNHWLKDKDTDFNLFICGGDLDGNGLASCLMLTEFHHFTLRDITLRNGRKYGLRVQDYGHSYELVANNVYGRCYLPGLAGNVGISINGGDSHYTDCIMVDYTIGMEITSGGSNRLTRCHIWGGPLPPRQEGEDREMLVNSINFKIAGADTLLRDCYADTGKTGFLIEGNARLLGCAYYNNFKAFKLDDVTVIRHRKGKLLVADCYFTKTSPKATVYEGIGGVIWRDNIYNRFDEADLPK